MCQQFETNLFGPMNVTRAVLPLMRAQRAGHVITITSTAGLVGMEFTSAYAASKFAEEGWMESLRHDVGPFDIRTTIVEPGYFRTELLVDGFTNAPQRFVAGADAIEAAEAKAKELLAQAEASRELGDSLAYDETQV
jgi:NAD(P)-dependent dehydrogenase (short-subunit alcohol dehydrogenase family)